MAGVFEASMSAFAGRVQVDVTKVMKKVAMELHQKIVAKTPVDTGIARGNWLVAVARAPSGKVARIDKQALGSNPGPEAITMALSALSSYDALTEQDIFIVNNLAYIGALEHGHSGQAPAGMVTITVAEFKGIVRRAAKGTP